MHPSASDLVVVLLAAVTTAAVATAEAQLVATATPTRTRTCTPGSNPAPGCAYEGPTRTYTRTPTRTCLPGDPAPICAFDQTRTRTPTRTPPPTLPASPTPTGTAPPTSTCTPGANPAPSCSYEGPPPTMSPTPPAPAFCIGDCNGNGVVSIDELVRGVAIALEQLPIDECTAFPAGRVGIDTLMRGVRYSLHGCPPAGWCFVGVCDRSNGLPLTKNLCCEYARTSAQPQPVFWCSDFDLTTGACATPCGDPCAGCAGTSDSFGDLDCTAR